MGITSARAAGVATCGILLAALALPVEAQTAQQASRWLPFVGCWQPTGVDGDPGLLCFRASGDGVEMSNVVEGEVTATERLIADGVARPVTAEGCSGTESVEFSEDGRRVFTASSFLCEGSERRVGSGVMSFLSPTQWIDVRSLTVEGEPVAWVQRYTAATAESLAANGMEAPSPSDRAAVRARRLLAARDIVVSDVEEAVRRIDPQAVKVWVATLESEFDLSGSELIRLADSGVPEDLIDVMVAVSYPDRFVVTPEGVPENVVDRVADNAYRTGARYGFRSFLWDPFYAPIGYRRYGYSPFGYYGYGYGGYYGYVPATVVVSPRDFIPTSGGRIVRGQGYRGPGSGGSARPSPSGSSGGSGAARSSGGSGDSGSSSGSSRPARTAVPRRGN